ncbi:peptidase family M48-domain-containing protein [Irpex lacteus]|nr:peptidase family M48-domain-containing protein [Irpex lacteus]
MFPVLFLRNNIHVASRVLPEQSHSTSQANQHSRAKPRFSRLAKGFGILNILSTIYIIAHLEQAPVTGRWRMIAVSPILERKMAEEAHDQAQREFAGRLLTPEHVLSHHIHRVVDRLLQSNNLGKLVPLNDAHGSGATIKPLESHLTVDVHDSSSAEEEDWELLIVNDNRVPNARATYRTIVVFTGILGIAKDEQGLAAILGHEIGHVVARHHQEQISLVKPLLVIESLLSKVVDLNQGLSHRLAQWAHASLSINSRQQEIEADIIGLTLMARACYDPQAALNVLDRMTKLEQSHGVRNRHSFFSTHPAFPERAQALERWLDVANAVRRANPQCGDMEDDVASFRAAQRISLAHSD